MSKQIKDVSQLKDSRLLYEKNIPHFGYFIVLAIAVLLTIVIIWSIKAPKTYMITATGVVESDNKNYIMSSYTGEISDMFMEEGSVVEEGDVLLTIKSTDLNLQATQLQEQRKSYETKVSQYEKLVKSIQDDTNYFDGANTDDTLYYNQFEAYKSQVDQNQIDTSTYQVYGYTEEQIENELIKNQAKITELYHSAVQSAQASASEAKQQLEAIDAQLAALEVGQGEYTITANTSGIVHMLSDYDEGMVVQAASPIASIASEQDEYSIVVYVSPNDAARTHVGNKVDIAVSGLTQSVYGTISGKVTKIDSDISTSQSAENGESSSYFKVYIKPDITYLVSKEGNKANISNGMAVEARIQYDEVTYFDYVMEALGVLTR